MLPANDAAPHSGPHAAPRAAGVHSFPVRFAPMRQAEDTLAVAQMRHHARNVLQVVLCELTEAADGAEAPEVRQVLNSTARRIALSTAISDSLFGANAATLPMVTRLSRMAEDTMALYAGPEQQITVSTRFRGVGLSEVVAQVDARVLMRIAHEMVANAVKHGMHARLLGQIELLLELDDDLLRMQVSDDGWGPIPVRPTPVRSVSLVAGNAALQEQGFGIPLVSQLAGEIGGTAQLRRAGLRTEAVLEIPLEGLGLR